MTSPDVIQRLKSARGHLDAVIRMAEEDRYCIDVLHQINAVQGGLQHASRVLLDGHLRSCVRDAYAEGRHDDVINELLGAFYGSQARPGTRHCLPPAESPT